jgi:hypothetical protein
LGAHAKCLTALEKIEYRQINNRKQKNNRTIEYKETIESNKQITETSKETIETNKETTETIETNQETTETNNRNNRNNTSVKDFALKNNALDIIVSMRNNRRFLWIYFLMPKTIEASLFQLTVKRMNGAVFENDSIFLIHIICCSLNPVQHALRM